MLSMVVYQSVTVLHLEVCYGQCLCVSVSIAQGMYYVTEDCVGVYKCTTKSYHGMCSIDGCGTRLVL